MRFSSDYLDELKARLPVSEVVGKRVKLKKAGREWKGLSPFSKEKTPSFFVNDQKQAWFDFSSNKNGSIFDFVMMTEGVTFPEAVERLASMAGMALPQVTPEAEAREERRRTLHDVAELAAKFFEATLQARNGAKARGYLADRGIEPTTQLQFRIGYAPGDRFALKEHLGAQGISVEDMIEVGLLVHGDDIPVPYDRFRDRVMFPITDFRGRVIAFGGRALEKDVSAKYLNSPETPLFHKGSNLYNGATARKATHEGGTLIVVEGYVDVIAMVSAGFAATVAPLGTALTEEQLALLWKMADEPLLCFDGDSAGKRAAYRAVEMALPHIGPGKSLKFATLPEGQDPDDLVRSGGREAVADVLASARGLADMLWQRETEAGGFDTPERRAGLDRRIAEVTNAIADPSVRKYYRQDLEARIARLFAPPARADEQGGRVWESRDARRNGHRQGSKQALNWHQNKRVGSVELGNSPIHRGHRASIPRREALILLALLNHPWLLERYSEEITTLEFAHPDTIRLRSELLATLADQHFGQDVDLKSRLTSRGVGTLVQRIISSVQSNEGPTGPSHAKDVWPTAKDAAPEDADRWWHHTVNLHRKYRTLNKELKEAELALAGSHATEETVAWLRDVQGRLAALDGAEALIDGFGASSGRPVRTF